MISKDMEKAINDQINKELFSAYYYLSMASYLENENFDGMATFMKAQAFEEMQHVNKFYNYVNEQSGRVILEAIEKPKSEYNSPEHVFELAYEHEKYVTSLINSLVALSLKENDFATKAFLDWFITEQVEEESTMDSIVNKFKMVGNNGHGLLMLDEQMGQRTPPINVTPTE
jgi:ferritin